MFARTTDINMLSPEDLGKFPRLLRLELEQDRPGVVEIENLIVESFSNVRTGVSPVLSATVMLTLT